MIETCTPYGCVLVVLFGFCLGVAFCLGWVIYGMICAHRRALHERGL